jgi:hypothetical protein
MANNPFSSAPSGNVSRQIASVLSTAGSRLFGGKSSDSHREKSALSNQQHVQNVQRDVMQHVLGQSASEKAHKQKLSQGRQAHALGQKAADAAHQRVMADREHGLSQIRAYTPEGHTSTSISAPGVSATYKPDTKNPGVGQQFNTQQPPVNLDNV